MQKVFNKKAEVAFEKGFYGRKRLMEDYVKTFPNGNLASQYKKTLKTMTLEKEKAAMREEYRKFFCNPTCKGTVFEPGDPNKLSPTFIQELIKEAKRKFRPPTISIELERRKEIFGTKTQVLEDSFYKGLNAKTRKKLRSSGAISGCKRVHINDPPM
jgi:hypothetical protein